MGFVELRSRPTCHNCLAWSSDGELAVAGGEYVHILTPKHSKLEKEHLKTAVDSPWHTTTLRINNFDQTEWTYQSLAPLSRLSIGEEQSHSTVSALSWSPPGLAVHRRSVLAVLTTNLLLAFWETDGNLDTWKRTCIVNYARGLVEKDANPVWIRSCSWSGIYESTGCASFEIDGTIAEARRPNQLEGQQKHAVEQRRKLRWPTCTLAIVTDSLGILLLRVEKPNRRVQSSWEITVLSVFSPVVNAPVQQQSQQSRFKKALKDPSSAIKSAQTSFGPWLSPLQFASDGVLAPNAPMLVSLLAVACRGSIKLIQISAHSRPQPGDEDITSGLNLTMKEVNERVPFVEALTFEPSDLVVSYVGEWRSSTDCLKPVLKDDQNVQLILPVIYGSHLLPLVFDGKQYTQLETTPRDYCPMPSVQECSAVRSVQLQRDIWEQPALLCADLEKDSFQLENGNTSFAILLHIATRTSSFVSYRFDPPHVPPHRTTTTIENQISKACRDFEVRFNLEVGSRCHTWGIAAGQAYLATCITTHPFDMIEYTTTSKEMCTIFFEPRCMEPVAPNNGSEADSFYRAYDRIMSWILDFNFRGSNLLALDQIILGIVNSYKDHHHGVILERNSELLSQRADSETCTFCKAVIDFQNPQEARCRNGHPFSKYNLVFGIADGGRLHFACIRKHKKESFCLYSTF